MGFFSRSVPVSTDPKKIDALLSRGVAEAIVKEKLREKLLSGRRLRVKLGIDPTSPDLHLGRSIRLLKLRDFQELGHQVVFIVGDFTAVIGDTSDKDAERPMLSRETIEKNEKSYREQVGKLLDLSKAEFRYNSEWLAPLTYREIGEHADFFFVSDFVAREVIARRLKEGKRVSLREVLYPLMQGYDSVAIKADVELGGLDQKFNLLAGRTMQEKYDQPPQDILMNPLIDGLDGRKMSSSWGNTIPLTASAPDMFGKVMSMSDAQVPAYFELCTRVPMEEIPGMLAGHPKDAKMRLAKEITALYHGLEAAQKAAESWEDIFSKGNVPKDIKTVSVQKGASYFSVLMEHGLVASRSEFGRLENKGAITDAETGEKIPSERALIEEDVTLRVGKHRFIKIILK